MDDHHRVLLPRFSGLLVPDTALEVEDLLTVMKGTAGSTELASPDKVLGEDLANGLKTAADVPLDIEAV